MREHLFPISSVFIISAAVAGGFGTHLKPALTGLGQMTPGDTPVGLAPDSVFTAHHEPSQIVFSSDCRDLFFARHTGSETSSDFFWVEAGVM